MKKMKVKRSVTMLARTGLKQVFLGVTILTLTSIAQAVAVSAIKVEHKTSSRSSAPAPVLEPGTRFFAGDSQRSEFYILRADEPNPVIKDAKKKGPVFVNTQPLQAGIDADNLLAQPADAIDVKHILDDEAADGDDDDINARVMIRYALPDKAPLQAEQASAQNETPVNSQPLQTSIDTKANDKEQAKQVHDNTNFSKIKSILHQMTHKMAVKKVHSRIQVASVAKHGKLVSAHHQPEMKSVRHAVVARHMNTKLRNKTQIAVVKVRYIHLG
jgi:hypothetical protein